jgi:hypothetical protein
LIVVVNRQIRLVVHFYRLTARWCTGCNTNQQVCCNNFFVVQLFYFKHLSLARCKISSWCFWSTFNFCNVA